MEDPTQDMQNWKWKMFYYNTNDTRLFVPKRRPQFGLTLNFAHRGSYYFTAAIVCVLLAVIAIGIYKD